MSERFEIIEDPPVIRDHFVDVIYDYGRYKVAVGLTSVYSVEADKLRKRGLDIPVGTEGSFGIFSIAPAFKRAYEGVDPEALDGKFTKYNKKAMKYLKEKKTPREETRDLIIDNQRHFQY